MTRLIQLSTLRSKLVASTLALLVVALVASTLIAVYRLDQHIAEELDIRTRAQMRVAARVFANFVGLAEAEKGPDTEILRLRVREPGLITRLPAFEATEIVDSISDANRGTATFFRFDPDKQDFERIGTTVKKPDGSRAVGTMLGKASEAYASLLRGEAYRGIATILGEPHQTGYIPIVDALGKPIGILFVGVGKMKELAGARDTFLKQMALASLMVLALAGLALLMLVARLLIPFGAVTEATRRLASGESDDAIPHAQRQDELGTLARAVDGFRLAVQRQKAQEQAGAEEARALAERKHQMDAEVAQFRQRIGGVISRLQNGVETMRGSAQSINAVVTHTRACADEGMQSSREGAAAISDVAQATQQFSTSITEIASRSNEAAQVVQEAAQAGRSAAQVVGNLSGAVDKISTAVAFISSIASQTNLLALNATIEAARAGEAGKGFAVVAGEVKELSAATARSATEIEDIVRSIQQVTQDVAAATAQIGAGLETINGTTLGIASAVGEQEQVVRTIAANAETAEHGSQQVEAGFTRIHGAIEDSTRAVEALEGIAAEFSTSADSLVGEIESFLRRMAA